MGSAGIREWQGGCHLLALVSQIQLEMNFSRWEYYSSLLIVCARSLLPHIHSGFSLPQRLEHAAAASRDPTPPTACLWSETQQAEKLGGPLFWAQYSHRSGPAQARGDRLPTTGTWCCPIPSQLPLLRGRIPNNTKVTARTAGDVRQLLYQRLCSPLPGH